MIRYLILLVLFGVLRVSAGSVPWQLQSQFFQPPPPAPPPIGFAAAASQQLYPSGSGSQTLSVTLPAVNAGYALAFFNYWDDGTTTSISGVTWGGTPMTLITNISPNSTQRLYVYGYALGNVSAGSVNVVASYSGTIDEYVAGVVVVSNVVQTSSVRGVAATGDESTASSYSISVTSALGDLVVDNFMSSFSSTVTAGAGQTKRWEQNDSNSGLDGVSSTKAGASGTTSVSYSFSSVSDTRGIAAVSLKQNP